MGSQKKVYSPHFGHMTKMATTPLYGKKLLRIFISQTKETVTLGFVMQHWGHGPNKV